MNTAEVRRILLLTAYREDDGVQRCSFIPGGYVQWYMGDWAEYYGPKGEPIVSFESDEDTISAFDQLVEYLVQQTNLYRG